MAYKVGSRVQMTFFPPVIDDYVTDSDPVRVYDAFVNALDFQELGIPIEPYKAGAHEYHPKGMLKWTKERCEKYLEKIAKNIDRLVDEAEGIDQQEECQGSLVKLRKFHRI